jgi:predicted NBD/HSP70 family sugar kinase
MHASWVGVNFQNELQKMTKRPARVANDADIKNG